MTEPAPQPDPPREPVPLGALQRLFAKWESLHPYHPVNIVELAGRAAPTAEELAPGSGADRLRRRWAAASGRAQAEAGLWAAGVFPATHWTPWPGGRIEDAVRLAVAVAGRFVTVIEPGAGDRASGSNPPHPEGLRHSVLSPLRGGEDSLRVDGSHGHPTSAVPPRATLFSRGVGPSAGGPGTNPGSGGDWPLATPRGGEGGLRSNPGEGGSVGRSGVTRRPPPPVDVEAVLTAVAGAELNTPFGADAPSPVRLTVAVLRGRAFLLQTYQHWCMDGRCASELLARTVRHAAGIRCGPPEVIGPPSAAVRRGADPLFAGWDAGTLVDAAVHGGRMLDRMSRCHGPRAGDPAVLSVEAMLPGLPEDVGARLSAAARRAGATVNDVLLAAAAEAGHRVGLHRFAAGRRPDVAVGGMADLRGSGGTAARGRPGTGVLLSPHAVVLRARRGTTFGELLSATAAQTSPARRARRWTPWLPAMWWADRVWPWLPADERPRHVPNGMPLVAGVTNLRVPGEWLHDDDGAPLTRQWVRTAPAGPGAPLVVSATVAGGRLSVGLTLRRTGYSPADRAAAVDVLLTRLRGL